MEVNDLRGRPSKRYLSIICLESIMLFVHLRIIPIHPLIFLVWPLSLWLIFEILVRFKGHMFKMLVFSATFVVYVLITQILVVERPEGIFFNLEPVHSMPILSLIVFAEAAILFLHDMFITRSITFRDVTAYIGFASIIPWLSPSIVEATILAQWLLEGRFHEMTAGKCIGGAGLNDILFHYGGRNLVISTVLFSAGMVILHLIQRMRRLLDERRAKRIMQEEDRKWIIKVWEKPITLLSVDEQTAFLTAYGHLEREQQNEVLRSEILPAKGIILVNPKDSN